MAVKKAVAVKKKTPAVKKPAAKQTAKHTMKKGDTYVCGVCGLALVVDNTCGYAELHEIICCGKVMKPRKARAAKQKAAKATVTKKPAVKKPAAKKKAKATTRK